MPRNLAPPLLLPAILVIAFAVYAPTLNDWFSGDDFWFLRSSQSIPLGEYIGKAFDFRETGTLPEFDRYRPLYPVLWRLAYPLFGLDAWGYHAVLLAAHLGCTVVVWSIALRLTGARWAAGAAALVFALHPAYAEAVAWLSGGNRVLVTFPYLLTLLLFMKAADGPPWSRFWYAGSFLAFLAAVLLHSAAVTMAAVLAAYAFLVAGKPVDALRPRAWLPLAPFAAAAAALLAIQFWVRTNLGVEEQFRFGWHQYSNYGNYLGLALFPVLGSDVDAAAAPLARFLQGTQGLASVAAVAVSVLLLARGRWPYVGVFAVAWLYVSLLPDSTLRFVTMGRVLYMPGPALALVVVATAMWLQGALPQAVRSWAGGTTVVLAGALLVASVFLIERHAQVHSENAAENRALISQIRESVPSLGAGDVLYVVGAPTNLVVFDDTRLDALVELYYGEAEVRSLTPDRAAQVEASAGVGARVFRYRR